MQLFRWLDGVVIIVARPLAVGDVIKCIACERP